MSLDDTVHVPWTLLEEALACCVQHPWYKLAGAGAGAGEQKLDDYAYQWECGENLCIVVPSFQIYE